jgi:hypothetical protein
LVDIETDAVHSGDRCTRGSDPLANKVAHLEFHGLVGTIGRRLEWVGSGHRILTAT